MRITSGYVTSLRTQNQVRRATDAIAASLQRLSTGQRVTSWKEDADTLAIAQKLDAQTRGLTQATLNINHSIGMISTAEGAIDTQIEIVNRMREIALQSSNGSISNDQRSDLNLEMAQLLAEFSKITDDTEFNGQKLLNGGFTQTKLQISSGPDNNLNTPYLDLPELTASKKFTKTVGSGSFATRTTVGTALAGTSYAPPKMADLNGDGHLDVIAGDSSSGGFSIFLGNGDGTLSTPTTLSAGLALDFQVADINGDNILDIVSADGTNNTVTIYKGNGNGTFQTATTLSVASTPTGIATADVNEDGYQDLLITTTAGVALRLGSSSGTFTTGTTVTVGTTPKQIVVGDFNKDGHIDFATANNGTNNVSVQNGSGTGTFSAGSTLAASTGPWAIAAGDFNNDGLTDLAVTNASTNRVTAFTQTSAGTFDSGTTLTGQAGMKGIVIKDVNGDGNVDIVTAGSSYISTFIGIGDGTFNTKVDRASTNANALAVGDLNEDGANDVVAIDGTNLFLNLHLGDTQNVTALSDIDVSTQEKASQLISILDDTLDSLKGEQAKLAGLHSRLDMVAASNLLLSDNYVDAKSKSLEVDVALETAEVVRRQMLLSAQTAVLAQANVQMQTVIQLLKF